MNDQLQAALAAMATKATSAAENGAAFMQAELPDAVRQLLLWKAVESGLLFAFGLSATVVLCIIGIKLWKLESGKRYGDTFIVIFPATVAAFTFAIMILNFAWLQILIAPKAYLLSYALKLVK